MRDPYKILGVGKSASEREIKSAFRKLAKKHHPDQNADNPRAQERFAEVNQAYEILGDKKKRGQYDRGEIDAEGKEKFQGFEGFGQGAGGFGGFHRQQGGGASGGGFEDIINDIFGGFGGGGGQAGTKRRRSAGSNGQDVVADASLTLEEIVAGRKIRVTLPTGKTVDVKVPNGVENGQQIRLKGQGMPGAGGGRAGDVLITVSIKAHTLFKPEGFNLRLDLPVTLDEAVLGAKVRVPTLEGAVALSIPQMSSSGRVMRLKGKGLPDKSGKRGDILAALKITLPETADKDLDAVMEKWRAKRA